MKIEHKPKKLSKLHTVNSNTSKPSSCVGSSIHRMRSGEIQKNTSSSSYTELYGYGKIASPILVSFGY
jgi:hypothetical protein